MITVYKKSSIPKNMDVVDCNDIYFNKITVELLDERAKEIILTIDNSEMVDKYHVKSRFENSILNMDAISTGCKTVLNIIFNPTKIFDITECGENAVDVIYSLEQGNVTCSFPLISFDMKQVKIYDKNGEKIITDYDKLKEWWIK